MTCGKCADSKECRHAIIELPDDDLKEAFYLYSKSRTQMRVTFGGIIGLDYNALKIIADIYGIELDQWMMDCIQILEASEIEDSAKSIERLEKKNSWGV